MRGLLIRVAIIAAIAIGALVLRDKISGNAGDLQVGECFDQPSTVNTVVKDVQHHPCTDPHLAEVFFVGDYVSASATYPTEDAFQSFVLDRCVGAFEAYTGLAYDGQALDIQPFWPTEEGWGKGDKEITCFAVRTDGSQITGSVRKQ